MSIQIGVIGGSEGSLASLNNRAEILTLAHNVGFHLAQKNAIVITGGMDGVMRSACEGAKIGGGITVGTPGRTRRTGNEFIDVEICTPIDVGDFLFAGLLSCDALIVFPGGPGTWAEIYIAYRMKIPMIILTGLSPVFDRLVGTAFDSYNNVIFDGCPTPEACVEKALSYIKTASS